MQAARPQAPDAGPGALAQSGLPDAVAWWGEPGRPGWAPEAWLGTAYPATLAGLVRGGWRFEEAGRAPAVGAWPGVWQARSPLSWYDSLEVRGSGGGALAGFDGALAGLHGRAAAAERRARSTFTLTNGSAGLDENALTLARGDSSGRFGVDVMSGTRGATAGIERAGRHQWGGRAQLMRGRQGWEGSVAQRGAAARLGGGEEQAASGQAGAGAWRWQRDAGAWTLRFTRALDRHESFGGPLAFSTREAQETRLSGGFDRAREGRELGARIEWVEANVKRSGSGAFRCEARSVWGALCTRMPAAGGRLEVAAGAGRHGGLQRFEVAPSAAFQVRARGLNAAFAFERVLTPVWTDLAPGVEAFLQHAWMGTVKVATAQPGAWRARGSLRAGRVHSRALADRLPLEELWLRSGLRREHGTYDLALAEGGLDWQGERIGAGVEGFGLAHRSTSTPPGARRAPRADPDAGFRAWLGGRRALFGGDLVVGLRGEVAGVGARESQVESLRRLPAFVTLGVAGELTLRDVLVVIRVRNLEDRAREQSWTDSATGLPAVAGRRDLRLSLVWRLFD